MARQTLSRFPVYATALVHFLIKEYVIFTGVADGIIASVFYLACGVGAPASAASQAVKRGFVARLPVWCKES